jgi:hypothetical protein
VPGTRCRRFGLLAFQAISFGDSHQVPGTRCRRHFGLLAFQGISIRCQAPDAAFCRWAINILAKRSARISRYLLSVSKKRNR